MKNKLPCSVVRDLLPSYVDELTEEETTLAVKEHLENCTKCRTEYEIMLDGEIMQDKDNKEIDYLKNVRKTNKKKIVISIIASVLIVLFILGSKLFLIGTSVDSESVSVEITPVTHSHQINVSFLNKDSANVLTGIKVKTIDNVIDITARKVLVSPIHPSEEQVLLLDLSGIKEVRAFGKTIWKNGYVMSFTASYANGNELLIENLSYDFSTREMSKQTKFEVELPDAIQRTYSVYDEKGKAVIYVTMDEEGNEQVYLYDINTKKQILLVDSLTDIHHIIPRKNDYIINAVNTKTQEPILLAVDKQTYDLHRIEIPDDKYDDMYAWQIFYIPQTDELVIQATSNLLGLEIQNEWNSVSQHKTEEIYIPYSHYLYHDDEIQYLFTEEMPPNTGLVSNGKQVLVRVKSKANGDQLICYDINSGEKKVSDNMHNLDNILYVDDYCNYMYAFDNGIIKEDIFTEEEEKIGYEFKELFNYQNCFLYKK